MNIFKRNYDAVVKRGLITYKTTDYQFYLKLKEEVKEALYEIVIDRNTFLNEEIADCLVVCINWLIYRGVDIEKILTEIAEKNEKRAN